MKRLKQVAAAVSLAMVMSMGANVALAGVSETPGCSRKSMTANGVSETPGFVEVILFMATLIM